MKNFYRFLLLFLFVIIGPQLYAQAWLNDGLLKNKTDSTAPPNFYDIQKVFRAYEKEFESKKEENKRDGAKEGEDKGNFQGYNIYKRWEWFNEQRVFPTGNFPKTEMILEEYEKFKTRSSSSLSSTIAGKIENANWVNLAAPLAPSGSSAGTGRVNCMAFMPGNVNSFLIGTACGGVWKTTDGGLNWAILTTDNLPSLSIASIAIDPVNTNNIYIATGDNFAGIPNYFKTLQGHFSAGIYKSTDGGLSWNPTGLIAQQTNFLYPQELIIDPVNPATLLLVSNTGIWRNTNSGAGAWTQVRAGNFYNIEFNALDRNIVYATDGLGLWRSNNNGVNWTYKGGGYSNAIAGRVSLALTPADTSYIYLWGPSLGVKRSVNGGTSFNSISNPDALVLPYGYYDRAIAVSKTDRNIIQVGGGNGSQKSINGGFNWASSSTYSNSSNPDFIHQDVKRFVYAPGGTKLYALTDGGIFVTANEGINWTNISHGLQIAEIYRVANHPFNKDSIYYGTQDASTNLWDATTTTVKEVLSSDGMQPLVDYTNSQIVFACKPYGNLQKSINGGQNFVLASPGQSPWIAPYVMNQKNPQTMYIGTMLGVQKTYVQAVFLSWFNVSAGSIDSVTSLAVSKADTNYVYAAKNGKIVKSIDGGANWINITAGLPVNANFLIPAGISYLAVSQTDPLKVYLALSGYSAGNKVFKSIDGGNNWINISGSLPNVPVNCIVHVNGNNDEVYIGTDFGVFYRDIASADWIPYNTGLPNVIVNHLDIYYPGSKLRAGTYGRGLWEVDLLNIIPLPVELISFTGRYNKVAHTNDVKWATASETNNKYFEIMKSADGINFSGIGIINGAANSADMRNYFFQDKNPFEGNNYYRLKQVDINGNEKRSSIIKIYVNNYLSDLLLYPNPSHAALSIEYVAGFENTRIEIFNLLGEDLTGMVTVKRETTRKINIDISRLLPGIYVVKLSGRQGETIGTKSFSKL